MKKFKLNVDTEKVDIIKLLNEYSSSLSLDSGVLSGLIETRIIDNKIIYDFKIKYGENLSSKIFEICVLDMVSNISLTISDVRCSLIQIVSKFTNDELRKLIKEVDSENINHKLSYKADKLFKLYSNDDWTIGLDRFSDIVRVLEMEILKRIKKDVF